MSDIFISYARSTEAVAKAVGDQLVAAGHQVWRDDELPAHRSYSDVIEERLEQAKAVVVLWSAEAARSQWVRAEADIARNRGTLVQMSVDGTTPPIPFNQIQCADLNGWSGNDDHSGWKKVLDSVRSLTGSAEQELVVRQKRAGTQAMRVLVLPFENMSDDSEQEYFSDGISEDIITDLSKVSSLDVVARNRAFSFKNKSVDVEQLADDLGVTHVVEGSVRKGPGRVRITAQLTDAINESQLWADRFDRELDDIFVIQDEISKAIVSALRLKLLPKEKKAIESRGTSSSEAYDLYLLARQHWINGYGVDKRSMEIAVRICQRAVALDDNYAKAWGLMALAQMRLRMTYDVEIDPEPATARALELDPENVEAMCAKAVLLAGEDKREEAGELLAKALEIDPNSFEAHKEAAREFFQTGNLDRAIEHYELALTLLEEDHHGPAMLVTCYKAKGDRENEIRAAKISIERCEKCIARDPSNGSALGLGVYCLAAIGDNARAKQWIERALLIDPDNVMMRYNLACTLVCEMDDNDKAIEVLEPFFAKIARESLIHCEVDPDMDKIRDDPRFQKMLAEAKERTGKEKIATK
ncbi:TIR domain-containing protein [Sphingomicrobium marinum]|uniref:TIR domain-containing protein n=1 Tax=Sphingomicrobium marinum TaxID=1227950 RepID=UPI0022405F7D|nr:TIR domain-containing protein [Sphingomicrobium marinum]